MEHVNDLNHSFKDIDENSIQKIKEITKTFDEVLSSIPKLEFPEITSLKYPTGVQINLEPLYKPEVMATAFLPGTEKATETISRIESYYTEQLSVLSAAEEEAKNNSEEWEKVLAPLKRQFEIARKLSLIGEMGWTTLPGSYFESYMDCPVENHEKADTYFMKLLNNDVVETLFTEIISFFDSDNNCDILETINDYRDRRYKSSALIMFSLIDGVLIKNHDGEIFEQYKHTNQYKRHKRRPVGENAANNITEYFGHTPASFHFYHYIELKSCLPKLFVDSNDFSIPEHPINRNLITHGMMKRKVEKKDCLQLFLLFRNFIKYINDFNEQFGPDQVE